MRNKFFTKQGWLTFYAMACGYRHETAIDKETTVIFSMNNAELNTFDVIKYDKNGRQWETVEGINEARKFYRKLAVKPARRFERHPNLNKKVFA